MCNGPPQAMFLNVCSSGGGTVLGHCVTFRHGAYLANVDYSGQALKVNILSPALGPVLRRLMT